MLSFLQSLFKRKQTTLDHRKFQVLYLEGITTIKLDSETLVLFSSEKIFFYWHQYKALNIIWKIVLERKDVFFCHQLASYQDLAKANEKTVSKDNSVHPQRNCKCRGVISKTRNKLKKKCSNPLSSTISTKEILHN